MSLVLAKELGTPVEPTVVNVCKGLAHASDVRGPAPTPIGSMTEVLQQTPTNIFRWQRAFDSARELLVSGTYRMGPVMTMVYDPNIAEVADAFAEALLLVDTPRKETSKELHALILLSRATQFASTIDDLVPGWHARNAELFLNRVLKNLFVNMTYNKLSLEDARKAFQAYLHLFRAWASSTPAYRPSWSVAHSLLVVLESDRDCFIHESAVTKLTLYHAFFVNRIAELVLRDTANWNKATWDNAFGHICGSDMLTLAFRRASEWTSPDATSFVPVASIKLSEKIKCATRISQTTARPSFLNPDGSSAQERPTGEWESCSTCIWPSRLQGLSTSDIFQQSTNNMIGRLGRLDTNSQDTVNSPLASDESYMYSQLDPTVTKPFCIRQKRKQSSVAPQINPATFKVCKRDNTVTPRVTRQSDTASLASPSSSMPASPQHRPVPELQLTPPRTVSTAPKTLSHIAANAEG